MSFNSKYSGQQVENLLDQVANGNTGGSGGGGGITTELDPIFLASPAAKITDDNISSWNNKVDKVGGKQLSTEDFTTALKNKLSGLNNYDDTEIQEAVSKLRTDLDTLVSGDTTTAIKTFNEVIAFLDGLEDTEDLASIIASIEQQIAAKGTYSKPSTGIPKSDLASAVQTSLGKADTALQSEQYKGTVTSVKINGATKTPNADGVVDLGTIEGGGGSSSGGSGAYAEVNHGTNDTTFELTPNTFHVWDEVVELDLSFGDEQAGVANEYLFQFTSGATATSLTLPDSIKFVNDSSLVIAENKIYQISILNGLGALLEFDNSVSLIENKITVSSSGSQYVVTSQYPVASDVKVSLYTADGTVNCTINSGSSVTYATPFGPIVDPDPSISNVEPNSDSTYIYSYL